MRLADILRKFPVEIDAMPYRDSLDYITVHFEHRLEDRKFDAAVHGKELKS